MPLSSLAATSLNPIPELTITLTPSHLQANASDTQNSPVMFCGNASIVKLPISIQQVTVTLSASCIWPDVLSPSTMVFTRSETQQFFVTVVVPPKASSLEVGQLIVTGTAKAPGMPVVTASANAIVTVQQSFGLEVSVLGGPFEGLHAGSNITGMLTMNNTGNGLDSMTIELLDTAGTISTCEMSSVIDIKEGERKEVPFSLRINGSLGHLENASRDIGFRCTSIEARNQGVDYSKTAWTTLSFGAAQKGKGADVPPGSGGDGGGAETTSGSGGFPSALLVLIVLIVVLTTIYLLGRDRTIEEEPLDVQETGEQVP